MAQIVTDYDLSGGSVLSAEVSEPFNVRIHWKITGSTKPKKRVRLIPKILSGSGDYVELKSNNNPVKIDAYGNSQDSEGFLAVNADSMKVQILVDSDMDGILNVWTTEN